MCISKSWSFYSMCKNLRGQRPLRAKIMSSEKVDFGWVNIRHVNLFVSGPKFTNFFRQSCEELLLIKPFSACRYLDAFWRYSRSKSKVVRICAKFLTFFAIPNFRGASPIKFVPKLSYLPHGTSRDCSLLKIVGVTNIPGQVCTGKPWSSLSV